MRYNIPMTIEERLNLIKQVGEEIVGEDELIKLLESGEPLIAYDGFEPSGQIHIAQGLLRAININKMTKAGIKFKMWIADWHAVTNNKMGGDLEKLKIVAKYFIEVWKASGMDLNNVEFLWASDMVKNPKYWELVIKVGTTNKLSRFIRTAEFMGREESIEKLTAAQIMYPCMQIADIFMLGAKITQLGMDQRKVNMLAREIGMQLSPPAGGWKPVVVSHHMLMGLGEPPKEGLEATERGIALKMSKSKPDTAIFMLDTKEDVERKIRKAYCPEKKIVEKVRGKKYVAAKKKFDNSKVYPVGEAIKLVKETSYSKFDGTVELHLVVKKVGTSSQVTLPHQAGKSKKVEIANDETVEKLKKGKIDFDVLVSTTAMMPKLVPFAKLLGPKGLMPNPKNGTLVPDEKKAKNFSTGTVVLKTEKEAPLIHTVVGKVGQDTKELSANLESIFKAFGGSKKIDKAYIKATMGPSVKIKV